MEISNEIKKLIAESKNVYLLSNDNEPEAVVCTLALFYTLRGLGKNVNLASEHFPDRVRFLVPSADFISSPKNFVIAIPRSTTNVSQIYYEKTDESLKIHLTTDKGSLKKEDISFYFQDAKPDLVVTLGIGDFKKHLESALDSFGFLLQSPILNIDNTLANEKFGQENIIEDRSLAHIVLDIINFIDKNLVAKDAADCILAALMIYYKNFQSEKVTSEVFKLSAELIEKGANYQKVISGLSEGKEHIINVDNVILA